MKTILISVLMIAIPAVLSKGKVYEDLSGDLKEDTNGDLVLPDGEHVKLQHS